MDCNARYALLKLQALFIIVQQMIVLLMPQRQPLLHELFAAFRVRADAHWVAGRRSILGGTERK